MKEKRNQNNFHLLFIVAIVAIISIVIFVLSSNSQTFSDQDYVGEALKASSLKTVPFTLTSCSDTDFGFDYATKGTISGGKWKTSGKTYTAKTDSCNVRGQVQEGFCASSTEAFYVFKYCDDVVGAGYVCEDGACVEGEEVALESVLSAAENVNNEMERTRMIPDEITIGEYTATSAQYLEGAIDVLKILLEDEGTSGDTTVVIPTSISEPSESYPEVDLFSYENEELYGEPLTKEEYAEIIDTIDDLLTTEAPETLELDSGGEIRYPELIYFVSSILRFYSFYGYLPESYSLFIISPQNLVPWDVPSGYEEYTSVLGKHGTYDTYRYYKWPAHDYEMYKLASDIIGSTTDPYYAGELIYDYAKNDCYSDVGYFQNGQNPFEVSSSASEWMRFCKGTSGTPRYAMKVLMRALNLPHTTEMLYLEDYGWINTDIHASYGSDPLDNSYVYNIDDDPSSTTYGEPDPEEEFYSNSEDDFITSIKDVITYQENGVPDIETIALFVNPGDIEEYGDEFIVEKALSGGFNTIIITVKTALGGIYFTTTADSYEDYFEEDILTSLLTEAHANDLKVYAAVSVLQDNENLGSTRNRQWLLDGSSYVTDFVTPCDSAIRSKMNDLLTDLVAYDVDGIVLSTLYFSDDAGGENACDDYNDGSDDWRINLISDYANELIATIETGCTDCDVRILSWPLKYGNDYYNGDWDEGGAQNLEDLSLFGGGIILSVDENWWLVQDDYYFPDIVQNLEDNTGVAPGLSFYLTDEWEFPPEFYNGLLHYVSEQGVDFVSFHKINSLDGELGYAFSTSDYEKISEIS